MTPEALKSPPAPPLQAPPADPALEVLSGVGVHGGLPCRLKLRRRIPADLEGVRFDFPSLTAPLSACDLAGLPRRALRATILGSQSTGSDPAIATPEHLLAALLFFPGAPLTVRSDAAELPGLDGSALPFRDALARLFPEAARRPAWREYPCDLVWEHSWRHGNGSGCIRIRPAERFSVRYVLERDGLSQTCRIEDPVVAWAEVLPARTFVFHREWREAVAGGLMAGADRDSGLLLASSPGEYRATLAVHPEWRGGPYPLLNQPDWRMPDEPVRHKILDLLGDLALNGLALPRADIEIRNGGHHAHHSLLQRLLDRPVPLDRLAGLN